MKLWNSSKTTGFRWPIPPKDLRVARSEEAAGETKVYQKLAPQPLQRQYRLIVISGRDTGREFLMVPMMMKIGRQMDCFVRLSDRNVSREHAVLHFKSRESRYVLEDMQSTNGTFINGRRIRREYIRSGDEIRVGETVMRFIIAEPERLGGTP